MKRKECEGARPRSKRPADRKEDVRASISSLYRHYTALIASPGNATAFSALIQAPAGGVGPARLSARLIPRFLGSFPDQAAAAADVLTQLPVQQRFGDARLKSIEDAARQDALQGLAAVLHAAQGCASSRAAAVDLVLAFLLRLLPLAATDDSEEPEEEEGELSSPDKTLASARWVKHMLRTALELHPTITLSHCFSRLAAAAAASRSASSLSQVDPQQLRGVRMWLLEHLLKEGTPSRECTPVPAAAGRGTSRQGEHASRSCRLQAVLDASPELQMWVATQARSLASAAPEVRSAFTGVLRLLSPHQQLAASKLQLEGAASAAEAAVRGEPVARQQQQQWRRQEPQAKQPAATGSSFPPPPEPADGTGLHPGTGMLTSSWSLPAVTEERERQPLRRASSHTESRKVPALPGAICRVEPCLLVSQLPPDVSAAAVASALGAEEAWLLDGAAGTGSRPVCACATYKGVLEAAKAYLRHNGMPRFGADRQPIVLAFADAMPSCSRRAAAVSAEPSAYVWASKGAAGDAESITEELREAGMQLSHVHRVNNAVEPGTLLQTPSAQHAEAVVAHLLRKHPQPFRLAAAAVAQQPEHLPPLPADPPPPTEWSAPGRAAPEGQQRQAAASGSRTALQQQFGGAADAAAAAAAGDFRRSYSQPAALAARRVSPCSPALQGSRERGSVGVPEPQQARAAPMQQHQQQQQQLARQPHHAARTGLIAPPAPPPFPPPAPAAAATAADNIAETAASGKTSAWPAGHNGPALPPQHQHGAQPASRQPAAYPVSQAQHGLQQRQQGWQRMPLAVPASAAGPGLQSRTGGEVAAAGAALQGSAPAVAGHSVPMAPPPPPAPGAVLWQGSLVKQQVRLCGVVCADQGSPGACSHLLGCAPEPRLWPPQLLVNHRISVIEAVDQYANSQPNQRAVRRLLPLDPARGDVQKLQQFIHYLNGKNRAGMVKLPVSREQGLGPRAMYLIVPTAQVCQQLQVAWDQQEVMLIALVVPQPGGV